MDWRNSVAREVKGAVNDVDPFEFADAWRGEYDPAMRKIREGDRGYTALDQLHFENLQNVLARFDARADDPTLLNKAWEKLDPWPDVVDGLSAIKNQMIVAPCSNGSIALMTQLARYAGLPWDCILGAEIAQNYKPHPDVYHACASALQLPVEEIVMVAAHNGDLAAARNEGLKTAFVCRSTEHGSNQSTDLEPEQEWDFIARDFANLAQQLEQNI